MKSNDINYRFDLTKLKENIKVLRNTRGLTILKMAEIFEKKVNTKKKARVSRETLYQWEDEDNSRCPSVASLVDLCNFYNVNINSLLFTDLKKIAGRGIKKDEYPVILNSFPKIFIDFFKKLKESMGKLKGDAIEEVEIRSIDVVSPSYIAFKVLKENNSLGKPLHFLTIHPNLKMKSLRFVFSKTVDEIQKENTNSKIIKPSKKGIISFTIQYNQNVIYNNDMEFKETLIIKENQKEPDMNDIIKICQEVLGAVIKEKR